MPLPGFHRQSKPFRASNDPSARMRAVLVTTVQTSIELVFV
jgi:hypothetical protein